MQPHYGGGAVSFRSPKLTNRRKSEKTSRFWLSEVLVALEPVVGPLGPGPVIPENIPSAALPIGRDIRLAPGLTRLPPACPVAGGSISKDDKNDVASRSVFVLVIVKKESNRLFWIGFGVPFKSKIYIGCCQQTI